MIATQKISTKYLTSSKNPIRGLFLYITEFKMSYLQDWIDAFRESKNFLLDFIDLSISDIRELSCKIKIMSEEEFVILHHSILRTPQNIKKIRKILPVLQERKSGLIAFVGDEVNLHNSPIQEKITVLQQIQPMYICTQLLKEAANFLYGEIGSKIIEMPHALNENVFKSYKDYNEREYDIATISVPYPIYLGDNDRERLFSFFEKNAEKYNLKVNILRPNDQTSFSRLDRDGWVRFLNNTKGTISNEAGTFFLEKDNKTIREITEFIKEKHTNKIIFSTEGLLKKIYDFIPINNKIKVKNYFLSKIKNVKTDSDVFYDHSYYEFVYNKFYLNREKPNFYGKAISSRHFDAIGTKTVQLLVEGRYNDILIPYEHYIPIKRDFSNIELCIDMFKDKNLVFKIINNAYNHCIENHTYKHRLLSLYKIICYDTE